MQLKKSITIAGLSAATLLGSQVIAADLPNEDEEKELVIHNQSVNGIICLKDRKPLVVVVGLSTSYTTKRNATDNNHPNAKILRRVTDDVVTMWRNDIRPHYTSLFQKAATAGTLDNDINNPDSSLANVLGFVLVPKIDEVISKHNAAGIVYPSISLPKEDTSPQANELCKRLIIAPS